MTQTLSKKQWKTIILSSLGGGLEYYDFVIFIVFAQYIGKNFSYSSNQNTMAPLFFSLALFAIGYLARPLGGILFSHLGDKFGRKKAFALSISIMAASTLSMGLLPSYETLGIYSTIIFTLLRIIQGLSLGGELPGAITFLTEHCSKRPGLACGILYFCVNSGIALADGVQAILAYFFTPNDLMNFGWRIAFLIGSSLAILAYFLRKRLEETPAFLEIQNHVQKIPFWGLLKKHSRQILIGFLIFSLAPLSVTLLLLYINSYLTLIHLDIKGIPNITLINAMTVSCFILFFGIMADQWSPKRLLSLTAFIFLCLSPWAFHQIISANTVHIMLWLSFLSVFVGCSVISSILLVARLFPTEVRYSGIAICYNLGFAIFGGLSPLTASYLIENGQIIAPAFLLQFGAVLTLIGIAALTFTQKKSLNTKTCRLTVFSNN